MDWDSEVSTEPVPVMKAAGAGAISSGFGYGAACAATSIVRHRHLEGLGHEPLAALVDERLAR